MESNETPVTWGKEVSVVNGEQIETCIVMFQEDVDMLPDDTAFEVMVQAVDSVEYLEDGTRENIENRENINSTEKNSNGLNESEKSVDNEVVKPVLPIRYCERETNQNFENSETMDEAENVSNQTNIGESSSALVDKEEKPDDNKETTYKKFNLEHLRKLPQSDKTTCIYCGKKMSNSGNMHRHMRILHNVELNKNASHIRCMQCDTGFMHLAELRSHLQEKHDYVMAVEEMTFPNMNAFSKWKCQMEQDTLTRYTRTHGSRKTPDGIAHFYTCHRSGKFVSKPKERKRLARFSGSCKTGFACTATMKVVDGPNGVKVQFCPYHYGHGNIPVVIVTEEDQKIIDETSSRGFTLDNIKQDIQKQSVDHFQLDLVRKKDMQCITRAYKSQEFKNFNVDGDNIEHWVNYCASMEKPPILLYQKDEYAADEENKSELILIIMSEFQKYFLCNSSNQVVCLDTHARLKGGRYYVLALLVIDETEFAIPVAFCISTKTPKNVITTFFGTLKEHVGPLSAEYFISDNERFYHETWNTIMDSESKWLWNTWHVENRLRCHLKVLRENPATRAHAHRTIKMLVECQNEIMFSCLYDDFINNLRKGREPKSSVDLIQQKFGNHSEMWAYCYRKDISFVAATNLAMMHETLRFCCERGRTKPMEKFIFVLMKVVREKILFRLSRMVDENCFENVQLGINEYHKKGMEIPPEYVTLITKNHWLVLTDTEDEYFYVSLDHEFCPEQCRLKCVECDICVHIYSCTCNANLFGADLCEHIHAVVWNFVTDHLPQHDDVEGDLCADSFNENEPFDSRELLQCVLQKAHELYNKVRVNKFDVKTKALLDIKKRLCECIGICDGKEIEVPTPSDAPESSPVGSNSNVSPSVTATSTASTVSQPVAVGQPMIIINPYVGYNGFGPIAYQGQIPVVRKMQVIAPASQAQEKSK